MLDEHAGGDAGAFEFGGAGPGGDGGEAGHVGPGIPLGFDGVLRGFGEFGDGAGAEEEFLGHLTGDGEERVHAVPVFEQFAFGDFVGDVRMEDGFVDGGEAVGGGGAVPETDDLVEVSLGFAFAVFAADEGAAGAGPADAHS